MAVRVRTRARRVPRARPDLTAPGRPRRSYTVRVARLQTAECVARARAYPLLNAVSRL